MRSNAPYEDGFLMLLLLLAVVGLFWLFSPFLEALFFAVILATATYAYFHKILARVKGNKDIAAGIMSSLVFVVVIAPVSYLLLEVGLQVGQVFGQAQSWLAQQNAESFAQMSENLIDALPVPESTQAQVAQQLEQNADTIIAFAKNTAVFLVQGVFGSTTSFLTFLLLAVFALYFFYRDGDKIAHHLKVLSPLENFYDHMIMNRFSNLSTILLLSVLGIALMQGAVFAVLAWFLGLPGLFIGTAIAITSFIPIVGAALVWIPLAIILAAQGDYMSAGLVVFVGAVVNGFLIDNLARPLLIQKIARSIGGNADDLAVANHTLITVLSTFAGLIHFGIIGLFFGPVIAAMAITVFDVYEHKTGDWLDRT
ncbi:MAG: AI-2E family transporter [Hydrogenovibrio sp.]|uniref:AI-2E family transporter n=1 Tax=Hydrogenovibrio sp. TaxID=2065821 RepID=UPI00286FF109|nr:AI-2E family transporter [Hydrogenovibrio sp.]MDR9498985.1 AI-2E family transporter [Hydrogenovibrio sp.]